MIVVVLGSTTKNFSVKDCDSDYVFPGNIRQRNCNRSFSPDLVNITISVPKSTIIKASTINNGNVYISHVNKEITTKNINGRITLENVAEVNEAHTINGDLEITFQKKSII